jgi:hypothetical protein
MLRTQMLSCVEELATPQAAKPYAGVLTIKCYVYSSVASAPRVALPRDRRLTVQAMTLLMQIDRELRFARADWNGDRFRRLMRVRPKAARRLQRRWARLTSKPRVRLGNLRRRYHANIAGYLYQTNK